MTDRIYNLFRNIAQSAMSTGLELSLEQKEYKHETATIGKITESKTIDVGVVLRVWQPSREQEAGDVEG